MKQFKSRPFFFLLASQLLAQAMLVAAGLSLEHASAVSAAVFFSFPLYSTTMRKFYRMALPGTACFLRTR